MSILMVETYVVKAGKREEFARGLEAFLQYKKDHPQLFPGLRSWRLYRQQIGSPAGMYMEMWEYDSLAAMEQDSALQEDKGMQEISDGFHALVEPGSFSTGIWTEVPSVP